MQPNEYGSEPYERSAGWNSSGWPVEPVTVRRTRSWAVALSAFLTGLVLIAALGNPSVTDAIRRQITGNTFKDGVLFSINSIQWRFGAASDDHVRSWAAHLTTDGVFLILLFLLVWIVSNGRGGFWQAFFGTWVCAVTAALVATYAGTAVLRTTGSSSKVDIVFFGPTTAGATTLFAALAYGFVIALVAGLVAVLSRERDVMVEAAPGAEAAPAGFFPPSQQQPMQQPPQETAGYPPVPGPVAAPTPWGGGPEGGDHPTEALPRTEDQGGGGPQHTAVLPPMGDRGDEQHTTQLPRTDAPSGEASETPSGTPTDTSSSTPNGTSTDTSSGTPTDTSSGPPTETSTDTSRDTSTDTSNGTSTDTSSGTSTDTSSGTDTESGPDTWPPPPRRDG